MTGPLDNIAGAIKVPVLSFFTGGGFLDMGFERAGFEVCWTNEVNPAFANMYDSAVTGWRRSRGMRRPEASISNRNDIARLTAPCVVQEAFGRERPPIFGVIGGPPCMDFSAGGLNGGSTGEHGRLTWTFITLVCSIRPAFFLMENVPGLYRTKKHRGFLLSVIQKLGDAGYAVDMGILNALELGVPQERHRLFLAGFEQALAEDCLGRPIFPAATGWFPWPEDARYTGAKDLPWPKVSAPGEDVACPKGIPTELTVYPLLAGDPVPESMANGDEVFKAYSPRFTQIAEGDVSGKSFKRLHRYRYSPTAWYGNNEVHLHPWKPRRLSVREALRIQSVPDEYVLPPGYGLTAKFKLVCNGVPYRMAVHLARSIQAFLDPALQ